MDTRIRNGDLYTLAEYDSMNDDIVKKKETAICFGAGDCFKKNIRILRDKYDIRFVVDNNIDKNGKEIEDGIVCSYPDILSKYQNTLVIITVLNASILTDIINQLLNLGCSRFEHVNNIVDYI